MKNKIFYILCSFFNNHPFVTKTFLLFSVKREDNLSNEIWPRRNSCIGKIEKFCTRSAYKCYKGGGGWGKDDHHHNPREKQNINLEFFRAFMCCVDNNLIMYKNKFYKAPNCGTTIFVSFVGIAPWGPAPWG